MNSLPMLTGPSSEPRTGLVPCSAVLGVFALCALAGCAEPEAPVTDAGSGSDAEVASDAAPSDAAPADAAVLADASAAADGGPPDAATCPPPGAAPSPQFMTLFDTLIRPGCVGGGRFCHEGEYEGFAMLTPEVALMNLVGVVGCAETRVVPCRPDESYVMTVMRSGGEPCGRAFPPISGGSHPTFSEAEIAAFESWIAAGAR